MGHLGGQGLGGPRDLGGGFAQLAVVASLLGGKQEMLAISSKLGSLSVVCFHCTAGAS